MTGGGRRPDDDDRDDYRDYEPEVTPDPVEEDRAMAAIEDRYERRLYGEDRW